MNDYQRNNSLPSHRFEGIRTASLAFPLLLFCLLLTACGGEGEEPTWEPQYYDYDLQYEISQVLFPTEGGEATLKLAIVAYDNNGKRFDYTPEHAYDIEAPSWIEVECISDSEFMLKVAPNELPEDRSCILTISNYSYSYYKYSTEIDIMQSKTDKKLQFDELALSSSGYPYEWFTDSGWHVNFESGFASVHVTTYDGKEPTGIYSADWISRVAVSERTWISNTGDAKSWYVVFYCETNTTSETRTAEVWVEHGDEKLGPFVIEQEKFHTMSYPGMWLKDWSNLSSNGTQCYAFLDCYNDEQPWIDIDSSWARVTSTEVAYTDEAYGMNFTRWRLIITVDKNYGSYRTCTYYCCNASGEYYGPFTLGQQGSGGSGGGGGGSSTSDESKSFAAYAWLETSGGYDHTMSLEHAVDHLNQYGITVYKSGSSYYFKNFEDKKVYCSPGSSSTYTYYSDYEAGDKYNNYQTKRAVIYVRFSFSAF